MTLSPVGPCLIWAIFWHSDELYPRPHFESLLPTNIASWLFVKPFFSFFELRKPKVDTSLFAILGGMSDRRFSVLNNYIVTSKAKYFFFAIVFFSREALVSLP